MKIIILAGSANKELNPLTIGDPVGSLHLISKHLINITLEALEDAVNYDQFGIQGGNQHVLNLIASAQKYLHWGTSIQQVLKNSAASSEEVLWLRDDVLYDIDFKELIIFLQNMNENIVFVDDNNNPVIFYRNKRTTESVFPVFTEEMTTAACCDVLLQAFFWKSIKAEDDQINIIDSVKSFYNLSMKTLKGELKHVILDHHQAEQKLIRGQHVNIEQSSQKQSCAYLGSSSYVHPDSVLYNNAILCRNSYIDSFVDISDSIILPNVYIGPYLKIHNAVVTKNAVIRVDTGNTVYIHDQKMITEMSLRAG